MDTISSTEEKMQMTRMMRRKYGILARKVCMKTHRLRYACCHAGKVESNQCYVFVLREMVLVRSLGSLNLV